ncbi:efflux pump [Pyricularia oryzae 70-15]|uniref:Efflux pump n=1 Tax=Pyricularia oryzae (strain 70-15 / ATCC MYA-4617 / FGSC 8958) TaxID=242507 RepID=G4NKQ7_PYRO7|nr:efflux pump, variant [Pyricularia oryzae 70-15]XP_003721389.1 efflux pump [Pyricularia oryzae 70-15]EHA46645.1 efflux pump, variant [Pyricularia oryzae 70-15]EHA46646.1 efflux pump [Pyricularia oryzae 70-15]
MTLAGMGVRTNLQARMLTPCITQYNSAALHPIGSRLYTYINLKWTFFIFLVLFEGGSLICGLASSSFMLIVGRAVAGMGSSGLMGGGLNIIAGAVPMHKRPLYIGILMGFSQLGTVCGPLLGGAFTQFVSWRWCFYINLPAGGLCIFLMALVMVPVQVPNLSGHGFASRGHVYLTRRFDIVGFMLIGGGSVMLLLALEFGGKTQPWDSSVTIGLLCGAAGAFVVFCLWMHRLGDEALIPRSLISQQVVYTAAEWAGYQFIAGAGRGLYLQIPILAVQSYLRPCDLSIGMSTIVFAQTLGAAIVLVIGSSVFLNSLRHEIPVAAPDGDLPKILKAGATGFRQLFEKNHSLPGIIFSYTLSLQRVFYVVTAIACLAFLSCWGMGWKNIGKNQAATEVEVESGAALNEREKRRKSQAQVAGHAVETGVRLSLSAT